MPVTIGVIKEVAPDETRVALTPEVASKFSDLGASIVIEHGAGSRSFIPDQGFSSASFGDAPTDVLAQADLLLKVQTPTVDEINSLREGAVVAGFIQGHNHPEIIKALLDRRITCLAVELIPRISRAQSMDGLSSQAAAAGYKATLLAANALDKFFPMLTTAAGTIRPAQVLVIGAGVAGLQAIATARRLGAVVEAYDVRSATKEQVESLGGRFVDTDVAAEGEGGYARELTDEERAKQQEVLDQHIAKADAVITTAAVPGRSAPRIISAVAVASMGAGSVIVDLAAEGGGNCELTVPGETVTTDNGVRILGPRNLPALLGRHASQMYARNLLNYLQPAISDGELHIDWEDEVFAQSVLTDGGEIRHEATRQSMEGDS